MAGFNTKWYNGDMTKPAYKELTLTDNNNPLDGKFNFRLLSPVGYDGSNSYLYPLIIMLHGAGERANCWGSNNCYIKDGVYDVKYMNNDHQLLLGGQQHLKAVYDANGKKAEDPTLNPRAFPGFVLFPQMQDGWTPTVYEQVEIVLQKLLLTYKIDPNRIYIHGLSVGGAGVWAMLSRHPEWYAAALPMSAVINHSDFTPEYTEKLAEIPIWAFQGGKDTAPQPYDMYQAIEKFKMGGGTVRYKLYPNLGHGVWNDAYAEPDFFSWMLQKNKSDIHVYFGDSTTCATNGQGVKLGISDGFLAYQWQKDGVVIAGATSSTYVATQPGLYKGRFSRISASPTEAEWNQWSKAVRVRESIAITPVITSSSSTHFPTLNAGETNVQLNAPAQASLIKKWYKDGVLLPDTSKIINKTALDVGKYTLVTQSYDGCPSLESNAIYITSTSPETLAVPTDFFGTVTSPSSVQLFWSDNSPNETGFELYRASDPNDYWTYVGLISADGISLHDKGLLPNTTYYYKLRAVSANARSPYVDLEVTTIVDVTPPIAPQNLTVVKSDVKSVKLTWNVSTDNVGIKNYLIYFGTTLVGNTASAVTSYTVTGLIPNSNYAFTVKAADFSGNLSQPSNQVNTATTFSGLDYEYSEGGRENLSLFDWNKAEFTGHVANVTLQPKTQFDYFYFKFHGYLSVTNAGNYQFRLSSDDGSAFYLGKKNEAYTEGPTGTFNNADLAQNQIAVRDSTYLCTDIRSKDVSADQPLAANSFYPFAVLYFDFTGDECLTIQYRGPDTGGIWTTIPNSKLTSGATPVLPFPPGIPTGLSANSPDPTMTTISLSWNAVSSNPAAQYQVYRSTDNASFTIIATTGNTTFTDTNLVPNTTYYYKLKSININGASDFSATVSKKTIQDTVDPSVPGSLTIVSQSHNSVALQWEASTDNVAVTGYNVYANNTRIDTTPYTTFTVSDLLPNITYNFTVTAVDTSKNESSQSNVVQFEHLITGIEQAEKQFTLTVYPNPSYFGKINLSGTAHKDRQIKCSVVDMVGKVILTRQISPEEYAHGVVLPDQLAKGLYVVRVNQDNEMRQQKFLVY